jgi:1-acyl-sn-glycerol-3-phosphate acyltransferase
MNLENSQYNWEYAPPPTPYDLVRDSILLKICRPFLHVITRLFLRYYNNLEVIGRENILDNQACIITPNHSSHLDAPVVFASLPLPRINRTYTLAAKDYFFNRWLVSFFARLMANVIPVDRTGIETRGLILCMSKIRKGNSILLFPEGTRSQNGRINQFKKGAILLSKKAHLPIIPAYIRGSFESLPKSRYVPKRKKISLYLDQPVQYWDGAYANMDDDNASRDLEERVRNLGNNIQN